MKGITFPYLGHKTSKGEAEWDSELTVKTLFVTSLYHYIFIMCIS